MPLQNYTFYFNVGQIWLLILNYKQIIFLHATHVTKVYRISLFQM